MKALLKIGFLLTMVFHLEAQECTGGLGINLFDEGDFGSGETYARLDDPMLAPGYTYVRGGPPNDGQYMITNQVSSWPSVFGTWLVIGDNSADPNGYMMVVNASFEPGLFYDEIVTGLCDNTTYEFSAEIINMIRADVADHIDPNVAFLINGQVVLETGNIPKNERWNSYSFSFDTEPGQTNVRLSLRNNAPGGIGNDLALDNITFRTCGPESVPIEIMGRENICESELPFTLISQVDGQEDVNRPYEWEISLDSMRSWQIIRGEESSRLLYDEVSIGEVSFRFSTASTSSSFLNEKCKFYSEPISLNIRQENFERFDTICGGTSITFQNGTFESPGIYREEYTSKFGCDSIIRIYLDTVKREVLDAEIDFMDPNCFGENSGSISAFNIQNGYPPYHIDLNGSDYPNTVANNIGSGQYEIRVEDRFNCFKDFQVELFDPEEFEIDIGEDISVFLGDNVKINITHNYPLDSFYIPGIDQDSMSTNCIEFIPLEDQNIEVIAISEFGCVANDFLYVSVDSDLTYYAPNIFDPRAQSQNNSFRISFRGQSLSFIENFLIFDRWGNLIWESSNNDTSWAGQDFLGNFVAPGVYVYSVQATLINNERVDITGSVTITY